MDRRAVQERFGILGDSPALRRVLDRIRQVAPVDITVLLEGESGVGKELFATALHGLSKRRHKKFVVVNCGAIPEGLIESELFGSEKGAYTGSVGQRTGFFEEADTGTLFLDEIGEMPLQAQVRLLRVLETGQYSRVGSSTVLTTDVRVVAATNKDLGEEVRAGRFREDLYYRLSPVIIQIPPLRQRPSDIGPLFETFMRRIAQRYDAPVPQIDPEARQLILRYSWPGNVRELRNVAEQSVVLTQGRVLSPDGLRPYLRGISAAAGIAPRDPEPSLGDSQQIGLLYGVLLEMRAELREMRDAVLGQGASGVPETRRLQAPAVRDFEDFGDEMDVAYDPPTPEAAYDASDAFFEVEDDEPLAMNRLPESLDEVLAQGLPLPTIENAERALLREALRRFDGNRRQTADALGISERTLYRKVKDLDDEDNADA
ncbi:MAG: sigma-54 dependent transcriptional regulator [Bacteroidota bacterium]